MWPLLAWLNSWVSRALLQRYGSAKTLMARWIKQTRQALASVVGTPRCLKEGMDFIFMILNYICLAIWGARVGTTDDASGKRCLVAVGEDRRSCSFLFFNCDIDTLSCCFYNLSLSLSLVFTSLLLAKKVPKILLLLLVRQDLKDEKPWVYLLFIVIQRWLMNEPSHTCCIFFFPQ